MKKVFKVGYKEYALVEPTSVIRREAQTEHSKVFGKCLKNVDIITRSELEELIKSRKMWDKEKNERKVELQGSLREKLERLEKGGIRLGEAKKIALDIIDMRAELQDLEYEYRQYDRFTAEALAEDAEKDYIIANCLVDNESGKKVFNTVDEFIEHKDDEIGMLAMINMMDLTYGSIDDIYKKLPENAFLIEYGFMNDKLHLVNKEGKLVDKEGRLIDENGYYIDENGEFVNKEGKKFEKIEKQPFLDDEGNPIIKDESVEEPKKEETQDVVNTEGNVENTTP